MHAGPAETTPVRLAPEPGAVAAAGPAGARFSVVCLSPQEWAVDLPTNRQQLMLRVAERGHPVLFVETGAFLGRRLWPLRGSRERLLRRLASSVPAAPGVRLTAAPNVLPWGHRFRLASRVNAVLTARALRRLARRLPPPVVLWLYDPCFADAVGRSGEVFAVYDCVDDYAEQAGADRRKRALVAACDEAAARSARLVFATARPLLERHLRTNARTHLVRNVGDYAHFAPAADRALAEPELAALERPVIGFAGNFLGGKVDLDLLEGLALERPGWTLLLVGPARAETRVRLERLGRLANVRWLGPRPYAELPRAVAAFDVALIPYRSNAYTRSCFPLKTFEYLAAGKPVVASGLPELAGLEPHVQLADGAPAFLAAVEAALLRLDEAARTDRQALAAANTWESRAETLLGLIGAELR
jgi:glycosyltransferase involved in cell wall biosynthesis